MNEPKKTRASEALKAYARRCVDTLALVDPPVIPELSGRWVRVSAEAFEFQQTAEPLWEISFLQHRDELWNFPEHAIAITALRDDEDISSHLDVLVGTPMSATRTDAEEFPDQLVQRMARRLGRMAYDDAMFDALFAEFEAEIARKASPHVLMVPLMGFEAADTPIVLGRRLEIDRLTDDEIARCLGAGYLRSFFRTATTQFDLKEAYGVRATFELPKIFGEDRPLSAEAVAPQTEAVSRASGVGEALRIFKAGDVVVPGYLVFSPTAPQGGQLRTAGSQNVPSDRYVLTAGEGREFEDFWSRYERAKRNPAIASAARRFGYAFERRRLDDRLVDLVISAESLLLSDQSQRTELRYRFSLRAAFYTEGSDLTKREVYAQMKKAYDARSAIVHGGGDPPAKLLTNPAGEPLSFQAFVESVEALIRLTLRKTISDYRGAKHIADWEGLIIPSSAEPLG